MTTLAITGGTGFVGATLIRLALEQGHQVRALTRRPQPDQPGVIWVPGALDDPASLSALMQGAEAVIHVAGVVNTPTRAGFIAGNIIGTEAMLAAAKQAGVRRFIHVSSLSAREPALSVYGWSKAEAEARVAASGLDWTMARPPAIYGPGDLDQLDLFKAAKMGIMPLPPHGRLSLLEVSDLSRLLLALVSAPETAGHIYEADDGTPGGWTHETYGRAIGAAMGRRVLALSLPAFIVRLGARADRLWRGDKAKLTADRAAYFCHPDWVISPAARPPSGLWTPQVETRAGLKATADWYRAQGWI
jgi:nucleoside-diphosphate-sugar epimerase